MRARLTVETGVAAPRVFEVDDTAVIRLGRNRENTIVLHDRHASRSHAKIFARNGHWFLRDQDTTNGTRIDGARINREVALRDGQRIDIGDVRFRFSLDPSKEATDQMRALPTLPEVVVPWMPVGEPGQPTLLQVDEMTALLRFLNDSRSEAVPHRLVRLALEVVHRQTGADLAGFLGLDDDPEFKVVFPAQVTVDKQLSRQLTQKAHESGRSVWLGSPVGLNVESESLANFRDAVCIPLRAGAAGVDPVAPPEPPLGTLHAYKSNGLFSDSEVRFCEVLAGNLASSLGVLRARRALEADNSRLRDHAASSGDELIGSSPAMASLRRRIERMADARCTVLIVGANGVGKELVALGLHRGSSRHKGPLVPVNCAAITASMPESELFGHVKGAFTGATRDHQGFFMQADMGTLFLDEIGELSLQIQAKLLRALESKSFRPVGARAEVKADVRIIAATNRDLEQEVREGRFRKDLFFRLTSTIEVPPLREHPEDIPELVEHFLHRLAIETRRHVTLSPAALARLKSYTWPGNVRQLRSVLEAAVAMAGPNSVLEVGDLHLVADSADSQGPPDRPHTLNLKELVSWAIQAALKQTNGNNTQAAKLLGIHRDTLIEKVKRAREGAEDLG